nr:type I inositol 1,4,5-trisphosphate 5-phosphatase-like [Ciona intestinalis]|eukprot:XP_002128620.1 type I inositol 1,4,5-trisphosphate 5-phosphatase-like [Ciona intestinalis]
MKQVVEKQLPKFIALHCQEIGGKEYKSSLQPVKDFFNKLMDCKALVKFSTVRGYLDGDFNHVDQYTALGNFYFVHESAKDVFLFNYTDKAFTSVSGKQIFSKDLAEVPNIRKEKFQQNFFPGCRWSRKGYSRVRWKIYEKEVEFVNIHLFHDDSNLVSIKSSPSPYTAYRKRALNFVTQRLKEDQFNESKLLFICGDFNFRLDLKALVQKICPTSCQQVVRAPSDDEIIRVLFRDKQCETINGEEHKEPDVLVKIEKKLFEVKQTLLREKFEYQYLKSFDSELSDTGLEWKEHEITFPPTYPFSENIADCEDYMRTRCPAWCDRILLSQTLWEWLHHDKANVYYNTIGSDVCMGDHKPVYLAFTAKHDLPKQSNETNNRQQSVETNEE